MSSCYSSHTKQILSHLKHNPLDVILLLKHLLWIYLTLFSFAFNILLDTPSITFAMHILTIDPISIIQTTSSFTKTCILVPQYYSTCFLPQVHLEWSVPILMKTYISPRASSNALSLKKHSSDSPRWPPSFSIPCSHYASHFNRAICFILEFPYTYLSFLAWVYCILEKSCHIYLISRTFCTHSS